jgi:hypothetical protein
LSLGKIHGFHDQGELFSKEMRSTETVEGMHLLEWDSIGGLISQDIILGLMVIIL